MELMKPISLVSQSVRMYVCPPFQLSLCVGVDTFHSVVVDTFPFISFSAFHSFSFILSNSF